MTTAQHRRLLAQCETGRKQVDLIRKDQRDSRRRLVVVVLGALILLVATSLLYGGLPSEISYIGAIAGAMLSGVVAFQGGPVLMAQRTILNLETNFLSQCKIWARQPVDYQKDPELDEFLSDLNTVLRP